MNSENELRSRLNDIEAAIVDLRPSSFGVHRAGDLTPGSPLVRRYRNRLLHALVLLYHLEADANRLARRRHLAKGIVTEFLTGSQCVRICWRAANTHKHGTGGRAGNATLPNALLTAVKDAHEAATPGDAEALVLGMVVSDAEEGTFVSQALLECAAREWAAFLGRTFDLDCSSWLERCFPPSRGPVVKIEASERRTVPQDARLVIELPADSLEGLVDDARRRKRDG